MKTVIKNIHLLIVVMLMACNGTAQEQKETVGTVWQTMTFEQALEKAGQDGKKVFVDCYTKTCVPCKKMVKNIFPKKECGDYFNANYVCIMMDMEEGEGKEIAKKYNVMIYPTYLVINPDGTLCCEQIGAIMDATKFVAKIKELVDTSKNR